MPDAPTYEELVERCNEKEMECAAYFGLLVPLLNMMGGEAVLTTEDMASVPENVRLWQEQAGPNAIKIILKVDE